MIINFNGFSDFLMRKKFHFLMGRNSSHLLGKEEEVKPINALKIHEDKLIELRLWE